MCRAVYSYELSDPDFTWLINSYQENNNHITCCESNCLPVVFLINDKDTSTENFVPDFLFDQDEDGLEEDFPFEDFLYKK